jgi:leader peptidase (prepilin peptidase)/N-methyltransferase
MTLLFIFIFGLLIGSFLNVLIWRLPQGTAPTGRSRCITCGHILSSRELIPVVSYIFQGGRCLHCKVKFSPRYVVIELITGALFVGCSLFFWPSDLISTLIFIKALFVVCVLLIIFVIDFEHYLILNVVLWPTAIIIFIFNVALDITASHTLLSFGSLWFSGLLAGLCAFLIFYALWAVSKGRWIGFGDVKLVFVMGLILGPSKLGIGLLLAFWLGALVSVPLVLLGKKQFSSKIPFGTFLSVATLIVLFWGERLVHWYLVLIGVS